MSLTLFRVENRETMQGLWYDRFGRYNGFIRQFPDALCRDLPMDFDPEFVRGGNWFSACDNLQDMSQWFSVSDLRRLHILGYRLYSFDVVKVRKMNGHATFRREDVVSSSPASLSLICEEWKE